ncbi:MAG: CDP-diacylglycerol--glycerol-3-phosphate 3-phosphatidyltransferase [Acidimicrobiia bacterium]|nr:MAG: CDP-diacylglycerol--glycerol-3-phosphate 3-phosphatidyltransferase [Acidimicrobiia bacterium]
MAHGARVWTIPNAISVARLACVPLFLWLLWEADEGMWAALLLAALGATDWVDGWIARRYDQGSELGKILDPTADRVLLVAAAVALLTQDMPGPVDVLLWIVLVREIVIAAVTIGLGVAGARRIDVVWAGKAGTLAVMFALPMFLAAESVSSGAASVLFSVAGWGFAIGGVVLGYYAAAKYVPAARVALAEGRAARRQAEVVT